MRQLFPELSAAQQFQGAAAEESSEDDDFDPEENGEVFHEQTGFF